jgi:hypothetical protein
MMRECIWILLFIISNSGSIVIFSAIDESIDHASLTSGCAGDFQPCRFVWCDETQFPKSWNLDMCPGSGTTNNSFTGNIMTGKYSNKWYCVWTIAPPNASRVILTFSDFFTEGPAPGTVGDWAYVWECANSNCSNSTLLGGFAGTAAIIPPSITASTGVMRVQFFSDDSWARSGFRATYRTPCPPGSFGQGMPQCAPCRTACPAGKILLNSCGGFDSVVDNACVCPPGEYQSASTCLRCGSCGPGATFSSLCVRPLRQFRKRKLAQIGRITLPLALLTLCMEGVGWWFALAAARTHSSRPFGACPAAFPPSSFS